MERRKERLSLKSIIIKTALIFILSYLLSLFLWMGVKNYYGLAITKLASYFVAFVKDVKITGLERKDDILLVTFVSKKYGLKAFMKMDIGVSISSYTFNAPLTFAIMCSFYPFVRRKRIYAEALLILIIVHVLYVFSFEGEELTIAMRDKGYEKKDDLALFFWEFLWGFVDNMVLRFEPFLIGVYLYFFRERGSKRIYQ